MKLIPINEAGEERKVALVVEHPSELKVIYLLTNISKQIFESNWNTDSFDIKLPLDAESFSADIFISVDRGLTYLKEKPLTCKGEEL